MSDDPNRSEELATHRKTSWQRFSNEPDSRFALKLFVGCLGILLFCWVVFYTKVDGVLFNLWVEFAGLVFDIFFILVILAYFQHRRQELQYIQSQHDIIEDYKRWGGKEAKFRLAGAMRRLSKMGVYQIDLTGAIIKNLDFARHNIKKLTGTTFYDGKMRDEDHDSSVYLERVNFGHVDCRSVVFSTADRLTATGVNFPEFMLHARFIDCRFNEADLRKAKFNGASLSWSEPPPNFRNFNELKKLLPTDDLSSGVHRGPFHGTKLNEASFDGCTFENADFSGAIGILDATFTGATGLDTALFDNKRIWRKVLAKAGIEEPAEKKKSSAKKKHRTKKITKRTSKS